MSKSSVIRCYCPCCESNQRMMSLKFISGEEVTASDGSPAYVCDGCGAEIYVADAPED